MPSVAEVAYHAECIICGAEVFLAPADAERYKAGSLPAHCNQCGPASKWPCPACKGHGGSSVPMRATSDYHRMHPSYRFEECEECHGSGVMSPVPSASEANSAILLLFRAQEILCGAGANGGAVLDKPHREALLCIQALISSARMLRRLLVEIDEAFAAEKAPEPERVMASQFLINHDPFSFSPSMLLLLLPTTIDRRISQIRKLNLGADEPEPKVAKDTGCSAKNEDKKKWWQFWRKTG